ncbi:hypothetical protein OH77DRAFT_1423844 [Trametes cingulata]|nr:hypothetical protein OH77DRAFT_1423844 [Trametes cingulata]
MSRCRAATLLYSGGRIETPPLLKLAVREILQNDDLPPTPPRSLRWCSRPSIASYHRNSMLRSITLIFAPAVLLRLRIHSQRPALTEKPPAAGGQLERESERDHDPAKRPQRFPAPPKRREPSFPLPISLSTLLSVPPSSPSRAQTACRNQELSFYSFTAWGRACSWSLARARQSSMTHLRALLASDVHSLRPRLLLRLSDAHLART